MKRERICFVDPQTGRFSLAAALNAVLMDVANEMHSRGLTRFRFVTYEPNSYASVLPRRRLASVW